MAKSKTDQRLTELWKREAAIGGSRDEIFVRTLAAALGLQPESDDERDFASEVWHAMGSRNCRDIPPPPRSGPTIFSALRVALRLECLARRTVGANVRRALSIQRAASAANSRDVVLRERTIKHEAQDRAIYEAVVKEISQNGKHGAFARVAKRLPGRNLDGAGDGGSNRAMTSQNVGKRFRAWEKRLTEDGADALQAEMRDALRKRILLRRRGTD